MSEIAFQIRELEIMHKVSEEEINAIVRPTALFIQPNKLEYMELADAETTPTENHGDNNIFPDLGTQPYLQYSPRTDTSVAPDEPLPFPGVEARDATVIEHARDLPEVRI